MTKRDRIIKTWKIAALAPQTSTRKEKARRFFAPTNVVYERKDWPTRPPKRTRDQKGRVLLPIKRSLMGK